MAAVVVSRDDFEILLAKASGEDRACAGKKRYDTRNLATRASYVMDNLYPGEEFAPYRCPFCLCYHIGHAVDTTGLMVIV